MFPGDKFLTHFDMLEMLHMAHTCFTHIPSETCMIYECLVQWKHVHAYIMHQNMHDAHM